MAARPSVRTRWRAGPYASSGRVGCECGRHSAALIDHTNRTDRALLQQLFDRSEYILGLDLETAESWVLQGLSFSDFLDDLVEMFDFESEVDLTFDCRLPTGRSERDRGQFQ